MEGQSLMLCELILYACPTSEMAEQLDRYFAASLDACGANAAHRYMPHITLTGFFHDEADAIPFYVAQVEAAVRETLAAAPTPEIRLTRMALDDDFHRIEVESPWLRRLTLDFKERAHRESRCEAIRDKDWLHLSLAYQFPPEQGPALRALAEQGVSIEAEAGWEIRFYQRHPDNRWTCYCALPLPAATRK
jgi:hypothetical protein